MSTLVAWHSDDVDVQRRLPAAAITTYQAILMECQMPLLDGYLATGQIRALAGESRRTPIIAVTASAAESDQQRCLAAGMDDYLAKPLNMKALADALARWISVGSRPTDAVDSAAIRDAAGP